LRIAQGKIATIASAAEPQAGDVVVDTLLPALANLHSHSFQRAMAGMTEYRAQDRESFWTWRTLMYCFLDHLSPDHIAAIAALTFMEMQRLDTPRLVNFITSTINLAVRRMIIPRNCLCRLYRPRL
jgi:cytosine/adenosine deaminase-related metal-dependent hydrolase